MENSEQEFIIAVSGGSDSMCLLDLYKKQVKCVCHVNYNLRLSSIRDTEIVKEYCLKNNLNLEILNCDEAIKSKYHSEDKNEESSLRKIRYDFFCECAEKYNVNTLLVAHQYDDFLESAWYQKSRNTRSLYLGIRQNGNYKNLKIFRPLLFSYRKKDTDNYCKKNNISFGVDETNFTDKYTRNRIRKMMNEWDEEKYNNFKSEVSKYNDEQKNKRDKIDEIFLAWKQTNYSAKFFKNTDSEFHYYLLYLWCLENSVTSISTSKIENLIIFILKSNKSKKYRLGDNVFFKIN